MSSNAAATRASPSGAGLRHRGWLLALITVALGAIGAISVNRYLMLERELTESALARRAAIGALAATALADKFERLVDVGIALATRVKFQEHVAAGRWEEAGQILRRVPEDFAFLDRLFVTDVRGTLMVDVPEVPAVRGANFAERDWYKGVSKEWKPYVSRLYRRSAAPQRNVIAVAVPIRGAGREVAGILVLQAKLEAFLDWLRSIELGLESRVLVVDAGLQTAFDSQSPGGARLEALVVDPLVRRLAGGAPQALQVHDAESGRDLVFGRAPAAHGWSVITMQSAAAAFAARDALLRQLVLDGALIVLGAIAAVVLGTMFILQKQRADADRARRAELEHRVRERTAELEQTSRALEDLYDNAPCGYHSVDAEGRFVRMNATWLAWLGYRREEVVGKLRHPDIMTPQSAELFRTKWFPLFREQGWLKEVEFEYVRKDGSTFPGLISGSSIRDKDGRFVMSRSTVIDITERKRIEAELQALNAQLQAVNRELESFSYSVSHDLRAPLRAVDGYALMLAEDYGSKLDDEGRRLLGVVRASAAQMGRLIDDLLQFSQVGRRPLAAAPLDMRALAGEVAAELGPAFPQARIEMRELPPAVGDRALLRHVWMNLIGNALKYSARVPAPRVEIGGHADGAEALYWVRDNGAGFDMRYKDKLFNVFQRLHREDEFEGTGVGLAIVQRVILRHGGRVWAEGVVGKGACFSFALPNGGSGNGKP
ncbi:MAG: ATP-binding protein [Pseudomonadota bacterium]